MLPYSVFQGHTSRLFRLSLWYAMSKGFPYAASCRALGRQALRKPEGFPGADRRLRPVCRFGFRLDNDILFGEKGKVATIEDEEKLLNSEIFCFIGDADRHDPYVSPVYGEFNGFPPMYFAVGGHEMLLDDTLTVVKKLKENNIEVVLDVQHEMFHVYPLYGMLVPEGRKSFLDTMAFIKIKFNSK